MVNKVTKSIVMVYATYQSVVSNATTSIIMMHAKYRNGVSKCLHLFKLQFFMVTFHIANCGEHCLRLLSWYVSGIKD